MKLRKTTIGITVVTNIICTILFIHLYIDLEFDNKKKDLENIAIGLSSSIWTFYQDTPTLFLKNYLQVENHKYVNITNIDGNMFLDIENENITWSLIQLDKVLMVPVYYENNHIANITTKYISKISIPLMVFTLILLLINSIVFLFKYTFHKNRELQNSYEAQNSILNKLTETTNHLDLNSIIVGISHELNTPIGICLTSVSYLEDTLNNNDLKRETLIEILNLIHNSLDRMISISNRLKMLKIDNEDFYEKQVDLKRLIDIHYKNNTNIFPNKGIRISLTNTINEFFSLELVWDIIIRELMENAFIFSPDESKISFSILEEQESIKFIHSIESSFIPQSIRDSITKPFTSSSDNITNLGLGLFLVKNLVDKILKGSLEIISFENPVEFKISVPQIEKY